MEEEKREYNQSQSDQGKRHDCGGKDRQHGIQSVLSAHDGARGVVRLQLSEYAPHVL